MAIAVIHTLLVLILLGALIRTVEYMYPDTLIGRLLIYAW